MKISIDVFMTLLVLGAAVLALWGVVRWPSFGPSSLAGAAAHVLVALVGGVVVAGLMVDTLGSLPVPGTFELAAVGGALPPCVYLFVAVAWFTRSVQGLLAPYR
jgi:hypothetical protein